MFDLVIAGGKVVDGTGCEPVGADVAIDGDRIVAIGNLQAAEARERVNVNGLIVAPGFIDPHNHGHNEQEGGIMRIPGADNMVRQGVTTFIAGHCGGSRCPIDEHLEEVEKLRFHSNYATLIGYGTAKAIVQDGALRHSATKEESKQIERILREGMEAGALGVTTCPLGKPQSVDSTEEFISAAHVIAEYGCVYDSHIRDEGEWGGHIEAIEEVVAIARASGISAQISHIKLWGLKAWGDSAKVLDILDRAKQDGLRISADQYAYHGGYCGLSRMLGPVSGKYTKEQLVSEKKDVAIECIRDQLLQIGGPDKILLCPFDSDPELNGKSILEVAEARGIDPVECTWQLCAKDNLGACWLAMKEEEVRIFTQSPHVMVGTDAQLRELNDGYCHPRNYGNYPRFLGRFVREEKIVTLVEMIRKMTAMPAEKYGLVHRGIIAKGNYADLTIINADTIIDQATWQEPHKYPLGVEHVIVNGRFAVRDGATTDELPGRVVRRGD